MFLIVEFEKASGGGLAIVRQEWMTPRKKECFWPPFKQTVLYNKCLTNQNQEPPDETWTLYPVKRVFYSTDDIIKARQKLRRAESDSEILTEIDEEGNKKRKRKPSRKLNFSDTSDETNESPVKIVKLPKPPQNSLFSSAVVNNIAASDLSSLPSTSLSSLHVLSNSAYNVTEGSVFDGQKNDEDLDQSYCTSPLVTCTKRNNDACPSTNESYNISASGGFNLARILARIEKRMDDIQQTQKEILQQLNPSTKVTNVELPDFLNLPCSSPEAVIVLEDWITSNEEHTNLLVARLSVLGGRKVSHTVRNILQTIFTNTVAVEYNWTGKYNKKPLKDLAVIQLIPGIVRKNRHTQQASDVEIREVISSWFRFAKDRDGGRDVRRKQGGGGTSDHT